MGDFEALLKGSGNAKHAGPTVLKGLDLRRSLTKTSGSSVVEESSTPARGVEESQNEEQNSTESTVFRDAGEDGGDNSASSALNDQPNQDMQGIAADECGFDRAVAPSALAAETAPEEQGFTPPALAALGDIAPAENGAAQTGAAPATLPLSRRDSFRLPPPY